MDGIREEANKLFNTDGIRKTANELIYPWNNLKWDYQQFVKNKYNPVKLGIRKDGTFDATFKNMDIMMKQMDSLISDPNPDDNSIAGIHDQTDRNKNTNNQNKPYEDPFFNKKLDGRFSSSYFAQTGFCETKDNKIDCNNKNLVWLGDKCYKKKYLFLDNSPGLKVGYVENMNGLIPSLINDVTQLNPSAFMGVLQGYSVPGVDIQQCENEHFMNHDNSNKFLTLICIFIFVIVIFFVFIK